MLVFLMTDNADNDVTVFAHRISMGFVQGINFVFVFGLLCPMPAYRRPLIKQEICLAGFKQAVETVQKTSLGYAGGKPNPLNPPYQGDFPLNSPLIRGARGVKNDERWVSGTVSFAGTTNVGFLHSLSIGVASFVVLGLKYEQWFAIVSRPF